MPQLINIVESHPLPLSGEVDEWINAQSEVAQRLLPDEPLHVDEIHDKYTEELSRKHEWTVFMLPALHHRDIFIWNHQLGEGFKIDAAEGAFSSLAEVICEAAEDEEDRPATDEVEEAIDHLDEAVQEAEKVGIDPHAVLEARRTLKSALNE